MPDFLANGGEMGALISSHDWPSTPLGALDDWPHTLKSTLATFLSCPQPIFIAWGPQLLSFFNDAYRPMLGARLDGALGRPFAELWSEAWADVEPIVRKALNGEGSSYKNMPLTLTRNGYINHNGKHADNCACVIAQGHVRKRPPGWLDVPVAGQGERHIFVG